MIVYVESNFVLELVLGQEETSFAEQILNLAEDRKVKLVFPSFSIMEPFWTIQNRGKQRKQIQQSLNQELVQLQRSIYNQNLIPLFQPLTKTIVEVEVKEMDMLEKTLGRLLNAGESIPVSAVVYAQSIQYQDDYGLTPQDAIIFSSVIDNLSRQPKEKGKIFISRNWKDFDQEEIVEELSRHRCRFFPKFSSGLNYIQSMI